MLLTDRHLQWVDALKEYGIFLHYLCTFESIENNRSAHLFLPYASIFLYFRIPI